MAKENVRIRTMCVKQHHSNTEEIRMCELVRCHDFYSVWQCSDKVFFGCFVCAFIFPPFFLNHLYSRYRKLNEVDLHWSMLREVQVRLVSPGWRASSTRWRNGVIRGSRMLGMVPMMRWYSFSISSRLRVKGQKYVCDSTALVQGPDLAHKNGLTYTSVHVCVLDSALSLSLYPLSPVSPQTF